MLLEALDRGWADPRRLHGPARNARLILDNAREVVATCLGARPDEVTFTSSGTAAVHLGLLGLLEGRARSSRHLVHSAVEHSAVLHAARWHEGRGGTVSSIPVDRSGRIQVPALTEIGTASAAVVAVQSANHEVGTRQPLAEVMTAAGATPVFVDACASAGREPLAEGWSAVAASAHKWGGPAGVGVLLVRKGARWRAAFPADDRVDERATGFENVPAALASAAALSAVLENREETEARQHALVDRVRTRVAADVPDVEVVGDPADRLPHLVTFSCLYVEGEALVTELEKLGFSVASGSACTASSLTPSHVLAAMGVLTHGNVRLSVGLRTTEADIDRFLQVLPEVVGRLRQEAGR